MIPRALLLHSSSEAGSRAAELADLEAALAGAGAAVRRVGLTPGGLCTTMTELAREPEAVVFNLCGHREDAPTFEPVAAGLLELSGVAFTGSPASVLTCAREKRVCKALLFAAGIPTPGARVLREVPKLGAVRDMAYPLVVKPLLPNPRLGLPAGALVRSPEELREAVEILLRDYRQGALAEVYMPGEQFSVWVYGTGREARALPAAAVELPAAEAGEPRLASREAREAALVAFDAGEHLKVALATVALAGYKALQCRDCARVDLRLDEKGYPHVIEICPTPGLARGAALARAVDASGDTYEDFVLRAAEWAWNRR